MIKKDNKIEFLIIKMILRKIFKSMKKMFGDKETL